MTYARMLGLGLLVAALAVMGCGPQGTTGKPVAGTPKEEEHVHGEGPHGGIVFDLGKYHAEFTVDHDKKECTLYILGADEKTAKAVKAEDLTVTTKETKTKEGKTVAPMTIAMKASDEANGKATTFVGTDPGLGNVAEFAGTVVGKLDGKPSQGEFKEE